jgi:hypothetical protein
MPLVNAFDDPANGNSYCTIADADSFLVWSEKWKLMQPADKEAWIIAVSAQADRRGFYGVKTNPANAMQFPRDFGARPDDPFFGIEAQRAKLRNYSLAMLEYNLNRVGIGVTAYTIGDESIRHEGLVEPNQARLALWDYWNA